MKLEFPFRGKVLYGYGTPTQFITLRPLFLDQE